MGISNPGAPGNNFYPTRFLARRPSGTSAHGRWLTPWLNRPIVLFRCALHLNDL